MSNKTTVRIHVCGDKASGKTWLIDHVILPGLRRSGGFISLEEYREAHIVKVEYPNGALATQADRGPSVIEEINAERRRQIDDEGWTAEHDDQHTDHSLATVAACYALAAAVERSERAVLDEFGAFGTAFNLMELWPRGWARKWWKPKTRRRDLIRAGALIVAELERLDRVQGNV